MPAYSSAGSVFGGTIGSAEIDDDAVTLAKLENGTQGDILYYGAAGAPTRLAAGTAGQVLLTGGAAANPSWGTAGSFTLISQQVIAGAAAVFNFTSLTTSAYKLLLLVFDATPTGGAPTRIRGTINGTTQFNMTPAETASAARRLGQWIITNTSGAAKATMGGADINANVIQPYVAVSDSSTGTITSLSLDCDDGGSTFAIGSIATLYGLG